MEGRFHNLWKLKIDLTRAQWILRVFIVSVLIGSPQKIFGQVDNEVLSETQRCFDSAQQGRVPDAVAAGLDAVKLAEHLPMTDLSRETAIRCLVKAEMLDSQAAVAIRLLEQSIKELNGYGASTTSEAHLRIDLAVAYSASSLHVDAESELEHAIGILETQEPVDGLGLAGALSSLANEKAALHKQDWEVLALLKRALAVLPSSGSPEALSASAMTKKIILLELSRIYLNAGDQPKADSYRSQALDISTSSAGFSALPNDFVEAQDRGEAAMNIGDFVVAARSFEQEFQIAKKAYGNGNPLRRAAEEWLTRAYVAAHDKANAKPLVLDLVDSVYRNFRNDFPFLSEADRIKMSQSAELDLSLFCNFAREFHTEDEDLAGRMYDLALWSKGMILVTSESLRERVRLSKDPEVARLATELENQRTAYKDAVSSDRPDISSAQSKMITLERDLNGRLGLPTASVVRWQDVRDRLHDDEVAIEVLRFPDIASGRLTSSASYVALLIRSSWRIPRLVVLGSAAEIEGVEAQRYKLYVTAMLARERPSFEFWNVLEGAIGANVHRIYLSPDGVLNNFSFVVIPSHSDRYVIDDFDVRVLASTGDLTLGPQHRAQVRRAVLIGDPDFDLEGRSLVEALRSASETHSKPCSMPERRAETPTDGRPWKQIPATEDEIQDVGKQLCKSGWEVESLTFDSALKELLLPEINNGAGILHFATHGFFRKERIQSESTMLNSRTDAAMLNSGLVLAGANGELNGSGTTANGSNRSILSAFEISSLSLRNTSLVVLSACDTGISDAGVAREVFGLRRAFQIAGAQAVLMTMWSVPSSSPNPIIHSFYVNLLKQGSNVDAYQALRLAQLEARRNNDQPNSWGAFVLVARN